MFQNTDGYSDGAPEEVCETLIPGHLKPPQNTSCPYRIELSTYHMSSNHIKYNPIGGNQMMNLTLTGFQAFKGFIIQARMNDVVVGRFEPRPKYYRMFDCPDGVEVSGYFFLNYPPPWLCDVLQDKLSCQTSYP